MEPELLLLLLLALYLLPCAVQDLRTRHVSNWLTIPAFIVAWPLALWLGTLPFTLAVFAGCYVAWRAGGMGPADGKLAVLVAVVAPEALLVTSLLLALVFAGVRLSRYRPASIAGAVWLFAGVVVALSCRLAMGKNYTMLLCAMPVTALLSAQ